MARLTDADLARLVAALSSDKPDSSCSNGPLGPFVRASAASSEEGLNTALGSASATGRLGEALTREMRTYLGADIVCTSGGAAPEVREAWRFEGRGGADVWWLEFDDRLARAFANAMIGAAPDLPDPAQRAPGPMARSSRSGRMLLRLADRFVSVLGASVEATAPRVDRVTAEAIEAGTASASGSCRIAGSDLPWRAGVVATHANAAQSYLAPPHRGQPHDARPTADRAGVAARPAAPIRDATSTLRPAPVDVLQNEPDGVLAKAVDAAAADLADIMHKAVVVSARETRQVGAPAMPEGQLRLALSTGGHGSLVLSADRDAVESLAMAALDGPLPSVTATGVVVNAAAETLLRAALSSFARHLPGVAGETHRVVRLAEGALPARTLHYAIVAQFAVENYVTTLRWLVPAWMAGGARVLSERNRT